MYLSMKEKAFENNITGEKIDFDKIVKHNNNIYCYVKNDIMLSLEGISNIDDYKVEGGEFSCKQKTKEELQMEINAKLLKDSANLQIQLKKQQELNANLLIKIAQLGGNANA